MILPPETITYKFDNHQDFSENNNRVKDADHKNNEDIDIITYSPPSEGIVDNLSTIPSHGDSSNLSEPKVKEIHYHKHRHLHDYGMKQPPKHGYESSHVRLHSQKQKDDGQSRGTNKKIRATVPKEPMNSKNSSNHKRTETKDHHHHSGKSNQRQKDHSKSKRHMNNSKHSHHHHDGYLSKHSDHSDRFVDSHRFHPGESYKKYNEDQYFSDHNHKGSEEAAEINKHHYKQRRHKHSKNPKQHHRRRRY